MERIASGYSLDEHTEGAPRQLDTPLLRLDLAEHLEELRRNEPRPDGHLAKTLVKYRDLRVVLIALTPGASLGEHQTRARLSIQTLEGHVVVKLERQVVDLPAGSLLAVESSIPHDVEAREESAILLTLAWPSAPGDEAPPHP